MKALLVFSFAILGMSPSFAAVAIEKSITAADCATNVVADDLVNNKQVMLDTEDHSLRVRWRFEGATYFLQNYFLNDTQKIAQPVVAQQKNTTLRTDDSGILQELTTVSFVMNAEGKIKSDSLKRKQLFLLKADGSSETSIVNEDGSLTLASTRNPDVTTSPGHITYTAFITPESFQENNSYRIETDDVRCAEVTLAPTFLDVSAKNFFELAVGKFDQTLARVAVSKDALNACLLNKTDCASERASLEAARVSIDQVWDGLVTKAALTKFPLARERQAEHKKWLKARREAVRKEKADEQQSYYGSGAISAEARHRLDCIQLDEAASNAGIHSIGSIIPGC